MKSKLVKFTPCPYQEIGNGLAVVDIKQMLDGYKVAKMESARGLVDYLEANTEKIFYLGCARMISEYLGTVESEK